MRESEPNVSLMQFARLSGWWRLDQQEEAALTGLAPDARSLQLKSLTPALQRRIDGLVAVWKKSRQVEADSDWLRRRSKICGGHTPLSVLAEGDDGIDAVLGAFGDQNGNNTSQGQG